MLIAASALSVHAQNIRISGLVKDATTNEPTEFANVVLQTGDSIENARWAVHTIEKEPYLAQNKLPRDKQKLQTEKQQLHQVYLVGQKSVD